MNLLELKGIYKSYRRGGLFGSRDRFEALKGVDLDLERGSCVGLLGRSGSGKSTLGRIALDLEPPDAGEVLFLGRPVRTMTKARYREFRKNTQVVFQNSLGSTNPRFTAGRIVAEPILNFESPGPVVLKRKIGDLLERVGLSPSDASKYPHQFSGGELQRVCIARAIALNPMLIVLDEAVSSLDMLIQAKVLDLLLDLRRELGATFLFISHDLRVLLKVSDRLAVMHEGRLVEQSDNMEELDRFSHPMFTRLIDSILPPAPAGL
ncbi:MAG: ATP-binding cassette domain-containing protein [Pseudomonadota bacterium]